MHVCKSGSKEEPLICLTVIPLAYANHQAPDGKPLALTPPDPLNLAAPFPVMKENRR